MQTLERINVRVGHVLKEYPETRNDDRKLFWKVIQIFYDCGESVTTDEFGNLPNFDTISRARRKYQSEGQYLPTSDKVIKKRFKRKKDHEKFYKKTVKVECQCGGHLEAKEFMGYKFKQCLSCDKKVA